MKLLKTFAFAATLIVVPFAANALAPVEGGGGSNACFHDCADKCDGTYPAGTRRNGCYVGCSFGCSS